MVKNGLKNFLHCLRYYLTPLGIFAIALVIAFSVALPGLIQAPKDLFDGISQILNTPADWNAFFNYIIDKLATFDWNNDLAGSVAAVTDKSWITNTLLEAVKAAFSSSGDVQEEIINLIAQCIAGMLKSILWGLLIIAVGCIAGYVVLKTQIKRNIAKGSLKKVAIGAILKITIDLILMGLGAWLTFKWAWAIFPFLLFFIFANGFFNLIDAYYIHGQGVVSFKEIVNIKNFFLMYLTSLIIYAIGIGVTLGIATLINNFVGVFLGIPLLEITLVVVGLNAESYVKEIADEKENVALLATMMANGELTEEAAEKAENNQEHQEEQAPITSDDTNLDEVSEDAIQSAEEQLEEKPLEDKPEEVEEKHEELPEDNH